MDWKKSNSGFFKIGNDYFSRINIQENNNKFFLNLKTKTGEEYRVRRGYSSFKTAKIAAEIWFKQNKIEYLVGLQLES